LDLGFVAVVSSAYAVSNHPPHSHFQPLLKY